MKSGITISLVREARPGPFVYWDDLASGMAAASAEGFDAVELFPPDAATLVASDVRERMDRHKLAVAAVGSGAGWVKHKLRLTDPDREVRASARRFLGEIIKVASSLGAPAIIGSMQGRHGDGTSREQALDHLATELEFLSGQAADRGQVLLYEPLNRYETNLLNRVSDAVSFIEQRELKNVRLLGDLFHMNIEEADIAESLRQAGPWLGHIHFADSNRQAVGLGHTDIAPVAAALREIGYNGYLSAEVFPLPDSAAAARQTMLSFRRWFPAS